MQLKKRLIMKPHYDTFYSQTKKNVMEEKNTTGSPYALQDRLVHTLNRFFNINGINILQITALDNPIYREYIAQWLQTASKSTHNSVPVVSIEECSETELFGVYHNDSDTLEKGLLHSVDGGFLIISPTLLLNNPKLWLKLKSLLQGNSVLIPSTNHKLAGQYKHYIKVSMKLIIVGDRALLGDLELLEPDLAAGSSMYSEYELDTDLRSDNVTKSMHLIHYLCQQKQHLPLADDAALFALLTLGAREIEEQDRLNLCLLWLNSILAQASLSSESQKVITEKDIKQAIRDKWYSESYLASRSLDDILTRHVLIETEGKKIGQINGLTVVSIPGHPTDYGEPSRISCIIHPGDGELSDVERKVELGGSLHAKGMMIMHAYILSKLESRDPLPFTTSMVFEQSYCEVDGDSASLAELCVLLSALSLQPINQNLAVTGSVDQFGQVQSIGGINEKIEAFFQLCQQRGLTGKQGVIIPETNVVNLVLSDEVIEAVNNNQFSIYPVAYVEEAVEQLMALPLKSTEQDSIISYINQNIESIEQRTTQKNGWLNQIINWFNQR